MIKSRKSFVFDKTTVYRDYHWYTNINVLANWIIHNFERVSREKKFKLILRSQSKALSMMYFMRENCFK